MLAEGLRARGLLEKDEIMDNTLAEGENAFVSIYKFVSVCVCVCVCVYTDMQVSTCI